MRGKSAEHGDMKGIEDDTSSSLKDKFEKDQQELNQNHANKIEKLELQFRTRIENLTTELNKKQETVDELECSNRDLLCQLDDRSKEVPDESFLEKEVYMLKEQVKNIQSKFNAKEKEIAHYESLQTEQENIEAIKKQLKHMTDVYENKIETVSKRYEETVESLEHENANLKKDLEDKETLIEHLKKDLQAITSDIKTKLKDKNFIEAMQEKDNEISSLQNECTSLSSEVKDNQQVIINLTKERNDALDEKETKCDLQDGTIHKLELNLQSTLDENKGLQERVKILINENTEKEAKEVTKLIANHKEQQTKLSKEIKSAKETYDSVNKALETKESYCLKMESDLKVAKESILEAGMTFRQTEDKLREELREQQDKLESQGRQLSKLHADNGYIEDKFERGEAKLRLKEEELARTRVALEESEERVRRMDAFVTEHKERVKSLELKLQQTDQVFWYDPI